jgi:hypothetical protein
MSLLQRIATKQAAKAATKPTTKKLRKGNGASEFVRSLYAPGNAYDGAHTIIAKAKANGTWFDPDAKRERKERFKANRKVVEKRLKKLASRLGIDEAEVVTTKRKAATGGGTKKAPKAEGYKGHRPGCKAEAAHRLVDEMKGGPDKVIAAIAKLGIKDNVARAWYRQWAKR